MLESCIQIFNEIWTKELNREVLHGAREHNMYHIFAYVEHREEVWVGDAQHFAEARDGIGDRRS